MLEPILAVFGAPLIGSLNSTEGSVGTQTNALVHVDRSISHTHVDKSRTSIVNLSVYVDEDRLEPGTPDGSWLRSAIAHGRQAGPPMADPALPSPDELPHAPFTLRTTLCFDDPRIGLLEGFQVSGLHVSVVSRQEMQDGLTARLDGYDPVTVRADASKLKFADCRNWQADARPVFSRLPPFPSGHVVTSPSARAVAQRLAAHRTLTLYRLPKDRPISLNGQDVLFSANAVSDVCLAVVRSARNDRTFAGPPTILVLPKPAKGS